MCVHQWPCLIVFVFGISCLEGKILVSEAVLVLEAVPHWTSSDSFWNGLRIVGINSSWKCLVEFTYEAIWSWTFVCWEIFSLTFKNAFNKLFLEIYRYFFYNLSYNEISLFQICCFIFVLLINVNDQRFHVLTNVYVTTTLTLQWGEWLLCWTR